MMKYIFKRSDHKSVNETTTRWKKITDEDNTALFLNIPKSIHAKFKAYAALKGIDMKDMFIDWVEGLKFKDVTRH